MSVFKQETVDPLDIDRYIDLDQAVYPSPANSTSSKGKAIATPEFHAPTPIRNFLPPQQPTKQTFAGPSHQYDLHKQQTSLPPGALANSLAAAPRINLTYGGLSQDYGMGSSSVFFPGEDMFDFNSISSQNPTFGSNSDIEMDFDSPIDGIFSNNDSQDSTSACIDPHAIGGPEEESPTPTQSAPIRLWPGAHQAAMAKQQQEQEIQRQQQLRAAQQPQASSHKRNMSRTNGNTNRPPTDPVVEERISRLLHQMRHSSVTSSNDDASTPQASQHIQKPKKDEEDMDDDERLLASEEGKKLSSKERRQLRNKVSARAFRSRRKEYISQLEGEIASKAQDNDDLRTENDALRAENTRLTDLTRMLLSSPAFSTFLNELSANSAPSNQTAPSTQQQQQQLRKDVNPHQQMQLQQDDGAQVGMALMPETNMDFSSLAPANNWGVGMDYGFNAQVFSVTEIPEGPAVDLLSGKSQDPVTRFLSEAKDEAPSVEPMPSIAKAEEKAVRVVEECATVDEDVEFDESDPAFALFADTPTTVSAPVTPESRYEIFGSIGLEKAVARFDIVIDDGSNSKNDQAVDATAMTKFLTICSSLDALTDRLGRITSHLD